MTDPSGDLSLLIVDDDPRIRELAEHAARASRRFGVIRLAENGADALRQLGADARLPDIILTDLSMPGMDGFELVATLKSRAETKQIPVVMFSSSGLLDDQEHALAAGCEAFFPKPATLGSLGEILASVAAIALHATTRR
jgi:two-component system cell cycle response regulator DivK